MAAGESFSFPSETRPSTMSRLVMALLRFLPPATRAELLGGSAFIVISLMAAAWACKCRADALALERDSVMVEGKVVRLWVTSGNNGRHYRVAYEYPAEPDVGPRWLPGQNEIAERDYDRLALGGPVAVKVCRSEPANHLVAGARPRVFSNPLALPFVLCILAILALAGMVNLGWWWLCRGVRRSGMVLIIGAKTTISTKP